MHYSLTLFVNFIDRTTVMKPADTEAKSQKDNDGHKVAGAKAV